jgi:hypothetical protein
MGRSWVGRLQDDAGRHVRFGSKLRRTQCEHMSSGLPLKADIARCGRHIANVPQADYALATSDVVVKAALDIGATWS